MMISELFSYWRAHTSDWQLPRTCDKNHRIRGRSVGANLINPRCLNYQTESVVGGTLTEASRARNGPGGVVIAQRVWVATIGAPPIDCSCSCFNIQKRLRSCPATGLAISNRLHWNRHVSCSKVYQTEAMRTDDADRYLACHYWNYAACRRAPELLYTFSITQMTVY